MDTNHNARSRAKPLKKNIESAANVPDASRQPEPNKKQKFNRCFLEVRGLPLEYFHLGDDGRKWQQKARARKTCLCMLASRANPDGTFVRDGIDYSPKIKTLVGKENIPKRTFLRHCEGLRKLGLLTWTRPLNHYGRRTYTISFPSQNHMPDSTKNQVPDSPSDPRTWHVITGATEAPDSGKPGATEAPDIRCQIGGQSQQTKTSYDGKCASHPSFDDLPSLENAKTGAVPLARVYRHQSSHNTEVPNCADDEDTRERANQSLNSLADRIGQLRELIASKFRPQFGGVADWAFDEIANRVIRSRSEKPIRNLHNYLEKSLHDELANGTRTTIPAASPVSQSRHEVEPSPTKPGNGGEGFISYWANRLVRSRPMPIDEAIAVVQACFDDEKNVYWDKWCEFLNQIYVHDFPSTPENRSGRDVAPWFPNSIGELLALEQYGSPMANEITSYRKVMRYLGRYGKFESSEMRRKFEDRIARAHRKKLADDAREAKNAKARLQRRQRYLIKKNREQSTSRDEANALP